MSQPTTAPEGIPPPHATQDQPSTVREELVCLIRAANMSLTPPMLEFLEGLPGTDIAALFREATATAGDAGVRAKAAATGAAIVNWNLAGVNANPFEFMPREGGALGPVSLCGGGAGGLPILIWAGAD
jgi:hypothetical protein